MSPTRMRPVIKSTKKYQAPLRCQGKGTRLTLDDREEELGFTEVADTENVNCANKNAEQGSVACLVLELMKERRAVSCEYSACKISS